MIKVLTMRRPWAELLVNGVKIIESRTGTVLNRHVGPLGIHVSQKSPGWERDMSELIAQFPDLTSAAFAVPYPVDGCIIGTVVAGDTWRVYHPTIALRRECVFWDIAGRWLTPVTDAKWLPQPIAAKGRQSLWKHELLGAAK